MRKILQAETFLNCFNFNNNIVLISQNTNGGTLVKIIILILLLKWLQKKTQINKHHGKTTTLQVASGVVHLV